MIYTIFEMPHPQKFAESELKIVFLYFQFFVVVVFWSKLWRRMFYNVYIRSLKVVGNLLAHRFSKGHPPHFLVFVIATVVIIIMIIINSDNPCGMTCLSFSKTGGVTNHNGKPCESPHCTPPPSQGEGRRGYSNSYQDSTDRKIMKISKVF